MTDQFMRCIRCAGRKKIYKVRGAYSMTNSGGHEITCPMCNGEGKVKTLDAALKDASEKSKTIEPSEGLKDDKEEGKKRKPASRAKAAS